MAVVEVGPHTVRAGYIGEVECSLTQPSLLNTGDPLQTDLISILRSYLSESAQSFSSQSIIPLWTLQSLHDNMELHLKSVVNITTNVLRCSPEDPLMLVLPELWHERSDVLEGLTEIFLEEGYPSMYFSRPLVNNALASGRTSALVCDVGHTHTTVGAVLDGFLLRESLNSVSMGGDAVSSQFQPLLEGSWCSTLIDAQLSSLCSNIPVVPHDTAMNVSRGFLMEDLVDKVKCLHGYVHIDEPQKPGKDKEKNPMATEKIGAQKHSSSVPTSQMELRSPDGQVLHLTPNQRCSPFEVFFGKLEEATGDTSLAKYNLCSLVAGCKNELDPEWQLRGVRHLIAGGGARAPNFVNRLLHDLKQKDSSYYRLEEDGLFGSQTIHNGAWAGASMMASSSSFAPMWITRSEWKEEGASLLHRKLLL